MPHISTEVTSQFELSGQVRCYLCEIPKKEFSIVRNFSEIVCRGCVNFEGPDRIENLITEAREDKLAQSSPINCTECYRLPSEGLKGYQLRISSKRVESNNNNDEFKVSSLQQQEQQQIKDSSLQNNCNQIHKTTLTHKHGQSDERPDPILLGASTNKRIRLSPSSCQIVSPAKEVKQSQRQSVQRGNNRTEIDSDINRQHYHHQQQQQQFQPRLSPNAPDLPASTIVESEASANVRVQAPTQSDSVQLQNQKQTVQSNCLSRDSIKQGTSTTPLIISDKSQSPTSPNEGLQQQHQYNATYYRPHNSAQNTSLSAHSGLASTQAGLMMRHLDNSSYIQSPFYNIAPFDRPDLANFDSIDGISLSQRHTAPSDPVSLTNNSDKVHYESVNQIYGPSYADFINQSQYEQGNRGNISAAAAAAAVAAAGWMKRANNYFNTAMVNSQVKPSTSYSNGPPMTIAGFPFFPHHLRALNVPTGYHFPPGASFVQPPPQGIGQYHSSEYFPTAQQTIPPSQLYPSNKPLPLYANSNLESEIKGTQVSSQSQLCPSNDLPNQQEQHRQRPPDSQLLATQDQQNSHVDQFINSENGSSKGEAIQLAREVEIERSSSPEIISGSNSAPFNGSPILLKTISGTNTDNLGNNRAQNNSFRSDKSSARNFHLPRVVPVTPPLPLTQVNPIEQHQQHHQQQHHQANGDKTVSSKTRLPLRRGSLQAVPSGTNEAPLELSPTGNDKSSLNLRSQTSKRGRCHKQGTELVSTNNKASAEDNQLGNQLVKGSEKILETQALFKSKQISRVKCLTCTTTLADQDFVQCPSVELHKFCFPCSKVSIKRQQLENIRDQKGETKSK